ncbi:hypothetical protein MNBD_ALPHA12-2054 [hydrothermal vent metagenome]|uniref:NAD-dependent epimerase/dehydratase domain-containing protein n=1 Tax=hydrothermal vent metagenome TaxID=652676 RepID=A0A3B0TN96_9ZZZZ
MTGASGSVGTCLTKLLSENNHQVVAIGRHAPGQLPQGVIHKIIDIQPATNWEEALNGVDALVHMADGFNAFEHLAAGASNEAGQERYKATLNLARAAIRAGVKNFIYLSTIKAMAGSWAKEILNENSPARPQSLYGQLKLAAEEKIIQLATNSATRVISLRFPIVFGARSDGNFTRLLQLANSGLPLPLSGLKARRSLISLTSLSDAIATSIENTSATAGTYLVQDDAASLDDLLTVLRAAINRPARLFYLPEILMGPLVFVPGARNIATRLLKPLQIDDRLFRDRFSWQPPVNMKDELKRAAIIFKSGKYL